MVIIMKLIYKKYVVVINVVVPKKVLNNVKNVKNISWQ